MHNVLIKGVPHSRSNFVHFSMHVAGTTIVNGNTYPDNRVVLVSRDTSQRDFTEVGQQLLQKKPRVCPVSIILYNQ